MTTEELAELFLVFLNKQAELYGYSRIHSLSEYANQLGITDTMMIRNTVDVLKRRGFIHTVIYQTGQSIMAAISGEGSLIVQREGDTGIIKKYKDDPEKFIINLDQSVVIHGDIKHSNISAHSLNVTQSVNSNAEIEGIISQIINALQNDESLYKNKREDLLKDIEVLKLQLLKNSKDKSYIERLVGNLSNIASISSLVMQLKDLLDPLLK